MPASYYAVTTHFFSLFFLNVFTVLPYLKLNTYTHVMFCFLYFRPILLLHIVIESRGLRVSQPIFFVLAFLSTVHVVASLPRVLHAGP